MPHAAPLPPQSGKRVRRLAGHESFVNSCSVARGSSMIASGSDDGTVRLWDPRMSGHVQLFANKYQVTSVALNEAGDRVYAGGLDNDIKVFDLRKNQREMVLEGHTDTITGLSISPDGSYLLSNAMDNTLRCWDIRPFVAGDSRCVKTFHGAQVRRARPERAPPGVRPPAAHARRLRSTTLRSSCCGAAGRPIAAAWAPAPRTAWCTSGTPRRASRCIGCRVTLGL